MYWGLNKMKNMGSRLLCALYAHNCIPIRFSRARIMKFNSHGHGECNIPITSNHSPPDANNLLVFHARFDSLSFRYLYLYFPDPATK